MITQFHTKDGVFTVDTDMITDKELAKIGMTRQNLDDFLTEQPRNLETEIDNLKQRIVTLEQVRIK